MVSAKKYFQFSIHLVVGVYKELSQPNNFRVARIYRLSQGIWWGKLYFGDLVNETIPIALSHVLCHKLFLEFNLSCVIIAGFLF